MAHTLSAKKRIRQSGKRNALNRWRKRRVHMAVQAFEKSVAAGNVQEAEAAYRTATSVLDKVAGTGAIHANKAARKKSRLAHRLNAMRQSS